MNLKQDQIRRLCNWRRAVCFLWSGLLLSWVCTTATDAQQLGDPKIGLQVDLKRLQANGIRKITGKYLTLFTDLPSSEAVDELGEVFDQATKQWADYFKVSKLADFHATGFLIKDLDRFKRAQVIPQGMPAFKNGYTYGNKTFWMYEQPSEYMRRQLMIHEGTHAFLFSNLGEQIPAWYNEGMAELFASHQWKQGALQTRVTIKDRDDAPFWGRTKMVNEKLAAGNRLTVAEIQELRRQAFLKVEPYAWAWAISAFLDGHPDFQERFRKLPEAIRKNSNLNTVFADQFSSDGRQLEEQWRAYLHDLDYNIRPASTKIDYNPAPVERSSLRKISAERGWQNSGIKIEAGKTYLIRSKGRFVVRESMINGRKTAWPCEPNGVTLRYYRGRPLGELVGVVQPANGIIKFQDQFAIGLSSKQTFKVGGTLFVRANESPAELDDNSGAFLLSVVEVD